MDRHHEAQAVIENMRGLWNKQAQLNDMQRVAANSYARGLIDGARLQRGEKNDERQKQNG